MQILSNSSNRNKGKWGTEEQVNFHARLGMRSVKKVGEGHEDEERTQI